jgi:hypothetical protein
MIFDDPTPQSAVPQIATDWATLRDRLITATPLIPQGWFRWLHHHYLSRVKSNMNSPRDKDWQVFALGLDHSLGLLTPALQQQLAPFAWELGQSALISLGERCWAAWSAASRGLFLAGLSEHLRWAHLSGNPEERLAEWILSRIADTELSAENVLEIACEAVWMSDLALLQSVLEHGHQRLHDDVPRMEPFVTSPLWTHNTRWAADAEQLSNRVIDQVLEASLLRDFIAGVELTLSLRANPNLQLWLLNRSHNEHLTALAFAIREQRPQIVELLERAGAQAEGDPAPCH